MAFELRTAPAPERLAAAFPGSVVELRELSYGEIRDLMDGASSSGRATELLFAASLHVDGVSLGHEGVRALPGRFARAIGEGINACGELHDMTATEDEAPKP